MRRGAEMPSPGQILRAVEQLIEEADELLRMEFGLGIDGEVLPDCWINNPSLLDWPSATRCSEEGECPASLVRFLSRVRAVLCDMERAASLRRIEKLDFWKTPVSFVSRPWASIRPGSGDSEMRVPIPEARKDYHRLVGLVKAELERARASLLLGESAVGFEGPEKSTTKETRNAAALRWEIVHLYERHKHEKDGYVYPVCDRLDEAGKPILLAWWKAMDKLGIPEKDRTWAGAYALPHLRHRVQQYVGRVTKAVRRKEQPSLRAADTHAKRQS